MIQTIGYAAHASGAALEPWAFTRRDLRGGDVAIEVLFCGVCHSDLHQVRNDWGGSEFPMVPGHEIVGRVLEVGPGVSRFQVGDAVAVGCMVDSCQNCDQCEAGEEQYCRVGMTPTYNGQDRQDQSATQGGYSRHLVCREEFVLRLPDGLDLARAAPLLCAGITTWSPLRTWGVTAGSKVGVVGMGGLGHMAIKLAKGLGAEVTVISRSPEKETDARELGADHFLISSDEAAMEQAQSSLELILDTVPVQHDLNAYLPLLDVDGSLVLVGQVGPLGELESPPLIFGRRRVAGSLIGGIQETQELLDFCAQHDIHPECETIRIDEINDAFERMEAGQVRYRFVIDLASLELPAEEK